MLFTYRYVKHDIEKFQTWLDHLVKEVWCRNNGAYSLALLHPDLKAVIEEIARDPKITKDHLDGPIKTIDALFKDKLDATQQAQISTWYDNNNDIEALCGNDPQKTPGTYAEIKAIDHELEKALKAFCKSLFTDVIYLKAVTSRTAKIEDHYHAFVAVNDEGKCPYCGYADIRNQDYRTREAYDHFLPKGIYPFNSVNFKNLAPMCHQCNSSYKLQKDPGWHLDPLNNACAGRRRRAFYSYAANASGITIDLALATSNIDKLSPSDITVTITAPGRDEEVESWMDVFGIEERYKAKCCAKNDGKAWLTSVLEAENYGLTRQQMLEFHIRYAENSPWSDSNFLKKPFLLACQNIGLI
jgi:hypothetical protein